MSHLSCIYISFVFVSLIGDLIKYTHVFPFQNHDAIPVF